MIVDLSSGQQVVRRTSLEVRDVAVRSAAGQLPAYATWTERDSAGAEKTWYAASADGRSWPVVRELPYEVPLRYAAHDPLEGSPTVPATLTSLPGSRLYLVQLWVPPFPELQQTLEALGIEIERVLLRSSLIVAADEDALERATALPFVRATTPYHPAYKLEPALIEAALTGGVEPVRFNLLSLRRGPAGQVPVAAHVTKLGGRVVETSPETYLMVIEVPLDLLAGVAASEDVAWIDRWSPPEEDIDIARQFHGADAVESTLGLTGASLNVEVLDGGCDLTHSDLSGALVHGTNTSSSHGTNCSGIVSGDGTGLASARGVLPDSQLIVGDYAGLSGSRYNHTSELQTVAGPYRAVLQSNSWGNTRTFDYTSISQDMDLILFDHERIAVMQSQSNAGDQDSRPQAWAKNIISVGGLRHYGTLSDTDDAWVGSASIGPAADGRIKPDIASFYDSILTTAQGGGYTGSFGGTSAATPITSGHVGLLIEMWGLETFGNSAPNVDPFDDRPHNTTTKALLINTATQWSFSGTGHDRTRVHQGWGRADVANAYDLRSKMFVIDESDVVAPLATRTHLLDVAAGEPALKATLVYRDSTLR